jgi:hypothetical protein
LGYVSQALLKEASGIADVLGQYLLPSRHEKAKVWLDALLDFDLRETPRTAPAFNRSLNGIWEACAELPACVWSREARKAWVKESDFWPNSASLLKHLTKFANAYRWQRRACEAIAAAGRAAPAEKAEEAARSVRRPAEDGAVDAPADDERARVRQMLATHKAELAAQAIAAAELDPPVLLPDVTLNGEALEAARAALLAPGETSGAKLPPTPPRPRLHASTPARGNA